MPTYTCSARAGWLDTARKALIASAVTRAHAEITGAPACFAQVMFREVRDGDHYVAGAALAHDHLFVRGEIRAGRSRQLLGELLRRLTRDIAEAAGIDSFGVWVYLFELPPTSMVEFGHVLPQAGNEAQWTASLPESHSGRLAALTARGAQGSRSSGSSD